ncbi:hypothetical protein AB0H49_32030 [Nocardia sp. NPDC050713]|uniref:hypothetical protein n=1 Tax=Nocardia sp. NPDC050713 TaxID=3154511 RepID=UPI0033F42092
MTSIAHVPRQVHTRIVNRLVQSVLLHHVGRDRPSIDYYELPPEFRAKLFRTWLEEKLPTARSLVRYEPSRTEEHAYAVQPFDSITDAGDTWSIECGYGTCEVPKDGTDEGDYVVFCVRRPRRGGRQETSYFRQWLAQRGIDA